MKLHHTRHRECTYQRRFLFARFRLSDSSTDVGRSSTTENKNAAKPIYFLWLHVVTRTAAAASTEMREYRLLLLEYSC